MMVAPYAQIVLNENTLLQELSVEYVPQIGFLTALHDRFRDLAPQDFSFAFAQVLFVAFLCRQEASFFGINKQLCMSENMFAVTSFSLLQRLVVVWQGVCPVCALVGRCQPRTAA